MKYTLSLLTMLFCLSAGAELWAGPELDKMVKQLSSEKPDDKKAAVVALGKLGPDAKAAVPALMKALRKDLWNLCKESVKSLGQIGAGGVPAIVDSFDIESRFPLTGFNRSGETVFSENGELLYWAALGIEAGGKDSMAALVKEMSSQKGLKKVNAAIVHIWLTGKLDKGLATLAAGLKDPQLNTRRVAAAAIGKLGQRAKSVTPQLVPLLQDKDKDTRTIVAIALGWVGRDLPAVLPALIRLYNGEAESSVRAAVIEAIARFDVSRPGVLLALGVATRDADASNRREAMLYVSDKGKAALPVLHAVKLGLKDEESSVRGPACEAIINMGPGAQSATPLLLPLLKDKERSVRALAAEAISAVRAPAKDVVPALTEALGRRDEDLQVEAALALKNYGAEAKSALPALIKLLSGGRFPKQAAAMALGAMGKAAMPAKDKLTALIMDGDEALRYSSAKALEQIAPGASCLKPLMNRALDSNETERVRMACLQAAKSNGQADKDLIVVWIKLLDSDDGQTRLSAVSRLGEWGEQAKTAVPALTKALKDPRKEVQKAAREAIKAIAPPKKKAKNKK